MRVERGDGDLSSGPTRRPLAAAAPARVRGHAAGAHALGGTRQALQQPLPALPGRHSRGGALPRRAPGQLLHSTTSRHSFTHVSPLPAATPSPFAASSRWDGPVQAGAQQRQRGRQCDEQRRPAQLGAAAAGAPVARHAGEGGGGGGGFAGLGRRGREVQRTDTQQAAHQAIGRPPSCCRAHGLPAAGAQSTAVLVAHAGRAPLLVTPGAASGTRQGAPHAWGCGWAPCRRPAVTAGRQGAAPSPHLSSASRARGGVLVAAKLRSWRAAPRPGCPGGPAG